MTGQRAVLRAVTPEAGRALGADTLVVDRFPFRVGRESRLEKLSWLTAERREDHNPLASNDLYILENGPTRNVSREHFQITRGVDGSFQVEDLGSICGTIVGQRNIGGHHSRGSCPLEDGSTIVVGTPGSPFVFKFNLEVDG